MEKVLANVAELEKEAREFASRLTPATSAATLVTLSGELGAGKTTFTQAVARALGVTESVTSPTFVLEKIYPLTSGAPGFARLIHIDAYRLKDGSELVPLDFAAILQDPENLILLEWPEMVADALPVPEASISLKVETDQSRKIIYA